MTTQLQFEIDRPAKSQSSAVLKYLTACKGEWIEMPTLVGYSGAYAVHSRVSDLRREGHSITNMVDRSTKPYKSFYRLN